MTISAVISVH